MPPRSTLAQIVTAGAEAAGAVLDAVLPPRCLATGRPVDRPGALDPEAWRALDFLGEPHCIRCGRPFAFDVGAAVPCGGCIRRTPAYDRARAVLAYDDASRPLVLAYKHGDRTDAAPHLAAWMGRAGAVLLADADLICPVPLHRWRLARRRYNQSALLALALGRQAEVPVAAGLLVRRRRTPVQGGLSRDQRRRNVAGAFAVRPRHARRLAGRRVLLVDDVMTTGATVEACARCLRRAGAAAVDVLTLARVVRPEPGD